jgi:hypothetical protein
LLALGGCHGAVHGYQQPQYLYEIEPNDHASHPDVIGPLGAYEQVAIRGAVTTFGHDPRDGFAFASVSPTSYRFRLYVDDPGADLDVWLYDPYLGEFTGHWCSPFGDEEGWFDVTGPNVDFHLVVVGAWHQSSYTLELEGHGGYYPLSPLAAGAGAEAARAEAPGARARDEAGGSVALPEAAAGYLPQEAAVATERATIVRRLQALAFDAAGRELGRRELLVLADGRVLEVPAEQ